MERFVVYRYLGIFVITKNLRVDCKNIRLFTKNGFMFYTQHFEAPGWANRRAVHFGLFMIMHISEGKSVSNAGWHLVFAHLQIKKMWKGFSVQFITPSFYSSLIPSNKKRRFYGHFARQ